MDLVEALLCRVSSAVLVMREEPSRSQVLRATSSNMVMSISFPEVSQAPPAEVRAAAGTPQSEALVEVSVHDECQLARAARALDREQFFDDMIPVAKESSLAVHAGQYIPLRFCPHCSQSLFVVTDHSLLVGSNFSSQERSESQFSSVGSDGMV